MNEFIVSFDSHRHRTEPSQSSIRLLYDNIASSMKPVNWGNIKSFISLLATEGCTVSPSTYKTSFESVSRGKDNFLQQQLFVLDFPKGMTFEEIKQRADRYDLPVLCAYDTHSNGIRVLWLHDGAVYDHAVAEAIQKALMTIFPEADPRCSDISRLYYGGKRLLHFDDTIPEINIDSLFMNMSLCLSRRHGQTHYKRKIAEFSKETGIRLNEKKLLDVLVVDNLAEVSRDNRVLIHGKKSTKSTIEVYKNGEVLPSTNYSVTLNAESSATPSKSKNSTKHRAYRSSDLTTLSSNCRLFREFESGSRILAQHELHGLASVLIQAETGDKRFKATLSEKSYYDDQPDKLSDWDYYFYYIKGREARPCAAFCPHQHECSHGRNAWSTAKPKYHQVEQVETYSYVTIKESAEQFIRKFWEYVNAKDAGWDVIKC